MNLQLITTERFVAIVYPMVNRPIRVIRIASVLVWLGGFAHQWRSYIETKRGSGDRSDCCVRDLRVPAWAYLLFSVQTISLEFFYPLINMTVCYSAMIISLRRKKIDLSDESQVLKLKAAKTVFRTFLCAAAAYLVCFAIGQIAFFLSSIGLF